MPEKEWQCVSCTHFVVCRFRDLPMSFIEGRGNLYNWIDSDADIQEAYSHMYRLMDNCKHFIEIEKEK